MFLDAIKFEHTVFALPFAYIGMVLADDTPAWTDVVWITVAMFAARTVAMGTNRIVDRHQDAANPRTRTRALPAGLLSMREMTVFTIAAAVLFFVAAGALNRTALALAPVALILLVTYPYAKRYTWLCHWYLGIADGIAPAAGWIAVTGSLELTPVLLFVAVTVWV
ncbi:MAG TPA: 4-hydroxybenzoate octaprenyltransferase, partial [Dehalococcoidia bacterium]|nr:4-hydroxybenzoate octaprenyltransferase [Dehalococcoidia bacterium]